MKSSHLIVVQILLVVLPLFSFAQKGTVRGTVYDDATGESMIGVTVRVEGTTIGAPTDFDGKFNLPLVEGTYNLQISFVSYQSTIITGVVVKNGEVTVLDNIRLKEDLQMLDAVVVTADAIRSSESAILTLKQKSPNLMDGISSAKFRQIGDSDASDAIKRVTGVSVEGGKYVFVRGLGDRYTKTMLNSVDIPGLDPDRNSIQIDIFPTNLIENMIVLKSSVAELPADFTGGVVNIETKDFPDEKVFDVSASVGFNPSMHFRNDFVTYKGSKTDFLGFDDGLRALPEGSTSQPYPTPGAEGVTDEQINTYLNRFNKNLSNTQQTNFMDYSLGISAANQKNFNNGNSLGYIFSTTYKNNTLFYDDASYGEYQRPPAADEYELIYATTQNGTVSERNILLGALGGLAFKTQHSKYKLALLHLQNGEKKAAQFFIDDNGSAVGKSGYFGGSNNQEYSQRGVTNLLLNGEHFNEDRSFSVDWRISPTISKIVEPDIRKTAFTYTSSDTVFSSGAAGNPTRIWRYLDEVNIAAKVDLKREYSISGQPSTLKFGASQVFKERDYEILSYNLQFSGVQPEFNGDPDNVLNNEHLYPNGPVYFTSGNNKPNANSYNSTISNSAFYISNQFEFFARLKAIVGVRAENYVQRHTGRDAIFAGGDSTNGKNLVNAKVLEAFDLFPSANLIFALSETQNLRLSYSRTIARPSFKELSYAQILDPVTNRTFNGALFTYTNTDGEIEWDGKLKETRIDNFDIRWEMFMKRGELLSISGFYKMFDAPIELVQIPAAQTTSEFQPRNVGNGSVLGVELEARKSLDFISLALNNFFFSGNFMVVQSKIDMTDLEYNARKRFEKEGQTIENTRAMAGQAPYIINTGISYENTELGIDAGLFYNVNGPTLTVVGGGLFPDVYARPFNSLNFNFNKSFGEEKKSTVTFGISNILNDNKENYYTGYQASDQNFSNLNPGVSFSAGFKYSF